MSSMRYSHERWLEVLVTKGLQRGGDGSLTNGVTHQLSHSQPQPASTTSVQEAHLAADGAA